MNIFLKFTLASLKKNRTRTLVTVIGILLSMALLTAVIEGANSGFQYLLRAETLRNGSYHAYYGEVKSEDVPAITATDGIRETTVWHRVGWSLAELTDRTPYLRIEAAEGNLTELLAVRLSAGRLPQNEREIILPTRHLNRLSERIEIGDTLTLSVGERFFDGEVLGTETPYIEEETLENCRTVTYTVVGIYETFDYEIETFSSPGFIALTVGEGTGPCTVFFTVDRPAAFYSFMEQTGISYSWTAHSDLLAYSGAFRNGNLTHMLFGMMAILIGLIVFGSVSLIYNSFSISVSERTRQFGILKSVGATKRQIRGTVLSEALMLCAVAIPLGALVGCAGIGITLYCLRDSFGYILNIVDADMELKMKLVVSLPGLLVSALLCLMTTLISSWLPARRALSFSPISAIRQSTDVKISGREVRTGRLTRKLFGFEGMMASKNFKRNRKRYRSTVISLFLSVTLFISAASFCSYLTAAVSDISAEASDTDISYYLRSLPRGKTEDDVLAMLAAVDGVERASYSVTCYYVLRIPQEALDASALRAGITVDAQELPEGIAGVALQLIFLDDAAFAQYCRESGVKLTDASFGVLYNRGVRLEREESSSAGTYVSYTLLKTAAIPGSFDSVEIRHEINGFFCTGERDANGDYLYLPAEQYEVYCDTNAPEVRQQMLRTAERIAAADAECVRAFPVGAVTGQTPFGFSSNMPFAVYPYSALERMTGIDPSMRSVSYSFAAPNHAAVFESMKRVLSDAGMETDLLADEAANVEAMRSTVTVVTVFSYGFIVLISLIALANVFNTISTNISLRRREFAMLKSVGLTARGLRRMMNYECIIYGVKGLAWGLPVSFLLTFLIWRAVGLAVEQPFSIPWGAVAIAVGSVFAVVFATMLYAMSKIRRDNTVDALKNENL